MNNRNRRMYINLFVEIHVRAYNSHTHFLTHTAPSLPHKCTWLYILILPYIKSNNTMYKPNKATENVITDKLKTDEHKINTSH